MFESDQFSLPKFEGRYFEPFLGGGAVFFHAQPRCSVLSDANERLIELYVVIRDQREEFEKLLKKHARRHSREYYYETRAKKPNKPITRAAQFLYLNRTCWNGLYRENLKGQFNVPIGTKQTVMLGNDDFSAWSEALKGVRLECLDFEAAIDEAGTGDFLFVDPPYSVRHNANGFVKYSQKIFAWKDQFRLCDSLKRAVERGASFAMTNADHESIIDLYSEFERRQLQRHSVIAGQPNYRARSTELLVTG